MLKKSKNFERCSITTQSKILSSKILSHLVSQTISIQEPIATIIQCPLWTDQTTSYIIAYQLNSGHWNSMHFPHSSWIFHRNSQPMFHNTSVQKLLVATHTTPCHAHLPDTKWTQNEEFSASVHVHLNVSHIIDQPSNRSS